MVLTWWMFMTSSMTVAIHLGTDFLKDSEICKNTRFENFENVFNITKKIITKNLKKFWMWEAWIIHYHHGREQHCSTIRRSYGRRQKLVSTHIPFYVLVGWNTDQEPQKKDGKANYKISRSIPRTKTLLDSMETQLLEFEWEIFPRIFDTDYFSRNPERLGWRRRTSNQWTSKTGSSSCLCSMTFCGTQMIRIPSRTLRKSRITRRNSFQDIRLFWVQGRKWFGKVTLTVDSVTVQSTKRYSNPKKLVILSSRVPVLQIAESWSRGEV